METVTVTVPFYEEVTIMKTEVKEEPFESQMKDDAELWGEVKEEVDPLSCVGELADKTDGFNFICSFCKIEFLDRKSFGEHTTSCRNNPSRLNQTRATNVKTENNSTNFTQKNLPGRSSRQKEKKFSCVNCVRGFYRKMSRTCHVNTIHLDNRRFKCEACSYATVSEGLLENHMLAIHSDREERYKCEMCDYSSVLKGSLYLHMQSHLYEKPFECTHRNKVHKCTYKKCTCVSPRDKPCECGPCNFSTAYKNGLERHVLVKHCQKPKVYRCTYKKCKHARLNFRSEEKPCICKPCEFVTPHEGSLRRHVLVKHSNEEKGYKCRKCKYSAHRKESLINHFRKHHTSEDLHILN